MPINDDKVKNDDSGSAAIVADDGDNQFEDIISDQENYGVRYRRRRRPGHHLATKKTTTIDENSQHRQVDTAIVDDNDEESCDAQVDENWFDGDVDALKLTDDPRFVRGRLASESNERPKFDRLSVRLQWSIIRRRKRRQERHAIKDYFRQKVANLLQITNIDAIREQWLDQLCTCNANADLMDERQQMMLQKALNRANGTKNEHTEAAAVIADIMRGFAMPLTGLSSWLSNIRLADDIVNRMQLLARDMVDKVRISAIRDLGHLTMDIDRFVAEFRHLEHFCSTYALTIDECRQSSFNANYQKARCRKISCYDRTRVVLKWPNNDTDHTIACSSSMNNGQLDDFIHASYVKGDPLDNVFILAQSPMTNSVDDFWRLIWQEKCELIIMFGETIDVTPVDDYLDCKLPDACPQYWPTKKDETMQYCNLLIKNVGVDDTADPLFQISLLEVKYLKTDECRRLQHFRYNWNSYDDVYWPFRILRRARTNRTPTLIHCLDGVGRSGTLVVIESVLQQLLKGPNLRDPIGTMAMFVRLQRRHAVLDEVQWMFIYRSILELIKPFIAARYHRLVLGLTAKKRFGFIKKYNEFIEQQRMPYI